MWQPFACTAGASLCCFIAANTASSAPEEITLPGVTRRSHNALDTARQPSSCTRTFRAFIFILSAVAVMPATLLSSVIILSCCCCSHVICLFLLSSLHPLVLSAPSLSHLLHRGRSSSMGGKSLSLKGLSLFQRLGRGRSSCGLLLLHSNPSSTSERPCIALDFFLASLCASSRCV